MMQKKTIETFEDIKKMVDQFYDVVKSDPLIGPKFTELAKVNWDLHLPKMYQFWSDLLLGTEEYRGRPFPPHLRLDLSAEHFSRWVSLFHQVVNQNFYGLKADEVKYRAQMIAMNFQTNIELIHKQQKKNEQESN